jgi:hypothetical protein
MTPDISMIIEAAEDLSTEKYTKTKIEQRQGPKTYLTVLQIEENKEGGPSFYYSKS